MGRQGLELHAVHLYGSPASDLQGVQDLRVAGHHGGVGVEPVGGGAHYDHVGGFFHRVQARDLRRIGVGNYGDPAALYPETSVSVPLDLHTMLAFRAREHRPGCTRAPLCCPENTTNVIDSREHD
jgi:hypothetical protein